MRSIEVSAPLVVVAAGAIESPLLLLRSRVPDPSGLLGKKLRVNPSVPVVGIFGEPIRGYLGIPQSAWSAHFADLRAGKGGYTLEGAFGGPATLATLLPGFGTAHKRIVARYNHMALVSVVLQDRTTGEVRLRRGSEMEIRYEPGREDRDKLLEGIRRAAVLLFRAGAGKVFAGPRTNAILDAETYLGQLDRPDVRRIPLRMTSTRPQGSCRMGSAPSRSVTGPTGEVHGVKGLFVADASLFPGPLGVPPQLTVMALAARTAEAIAAAAGAERSTG
jgi:choline dehydrogenase-like flavoprotein